MRTYCKKALTRRKFGNFTPFFCILKTANLLVKIREVSYTGLAHIAAHDQVVVLLRNANSSRLLVGRELAHRRRSRFFGWILHFVFGNFASAYKFFPLKFKQIYSIIVSGSDDSAIVKNTKTPSFAFKMRLDKQPLLGIGVARLQNLWIFYYRTVS